MARTRGTSAGADLQLGTVAEDLIADLRKRICRTRDRTADPEDIHRLRSDGRQLEALLTELAGLRGRDAPTLRDVYESVRRTRKRAGDVRDADVSRGLVDAATRSPRGRAGPGRKTRKFLHALLDSDRKQSLAKLERTLGRRRFERLPRDLRTALEGRAIPAARARAAIGACIARASRLAALARTPRTLHRARLAIKKIRDVSRLTAPALGPAASLLAGDADRLSDRLGQSQDLVVLIELIDRASKDAPDAPAGLRTLRRSLVARHRRSQAAALRLLLGVPALGAGLAVRGH